MTIQHRGPISGVAAFGDRFVATAGYDNQVILWDQSTGASISRVLHDHLANQCTFSPDGTKLLSSSSDYSARIWSVPELRLIAVLNDHEDDVEMSVFHPGGQLVATASRDHRVRVYDVTGHLRHTFVGHTADVISVEWAHNGDELITSSDDGTVKRWSLSKGGLVDDVELGGVETDTVAIHPSGTVYAGNDDGVLLVLRDGRTTDVAAHAAGIKRLVLDLGRNLLVSLSYDRTMCLWDVADAQPRLLATAALPDDVWPRSCAFAADSKLVFATFGATYRTYDYATRTWDAQPIPPTLGLNAACAFDGAVLSTGDSGVVWRDGQAIARTGSLCNFVTPMSRGVVTGGQLGRVFDALTGRTVHQHRSPLNCGARFLRRGVEHVLIGTYTGEGIVLVAPPSGEASGDLRHVGDLRLHDNAVKGVAVSGDLIFSVCADTSAAWHDVSTMERVAFLPAAHDRIANGCVGLGEGRFASVGRDLKLRLWEPDFTGRAVTTPHTHSIKCVAAGAGGRMIATGAYDGQIAVYDRATSTWPLVRRPTASGISSLSYDREGDRFLASSYDGAVHEVPEHPRGDR